MADPAALPDWYTALPAGRSSIPDQNQTAPVSNQNAVQSVAMPQATSQQNLPDWYTTLPIGKSPIPLENQQPIMSNSSAAPDDKQSSFPNDAPDTYYGSVLPIARNEKTGETSLAFPEPIRSFARGIAGMAADAGGVGQPVGSNLNQDELNALMMMSPGARAAETVGPVIAQSSAVKALKGIANDPIIGSALEETAANDLPKFTATMPPATINAAKTVSNAFYKEADNKGGLYSAAIPDQLLARLNGKTPTTPTELIAAQTDPLKNFASEYKSIGGQPMSLSDAQLIDERMGDYVDGEYSIKGLSKQGYNMMQAQHDFRDMLRNAGDNGQVLGGQEGLDAWRNGQAAWAQAQKMQDLNRIVVRAAGSENPDTIMRTGIRTMLANPQRMRGWSPDEIAALQKARDPGMVQTAMKLFGSKLIPIMAAAGEGIGGGGLTGGLLSGGAAHIATSIPRKIAQNMQANKMQNVQNTLFNNLPDNK